MVPEDDEPLTLNPLALASTDDLVAELKRRTDGGIISLLRSHATDETTITDYWGGLTLSIGMAERLKARLLETALACGEPDDEDG